MVAFNTNSDLVTLSTRINGEKKTRLFQVQKDKKLGEGGQASVFICNELRNEKKLYAVKIFGFLPGQSTEKDDCFKKLIKRELEVIDLLKDCKQAVNKVGLGKYQDKFCIVYQYCNGGSLAQLLAEKKSQGGLNEQTCRSIFLQLNEFLKAIDKKEWAHRDLKPHNIMLHFPSLPQWHCFKTMEEYSSLIARTPIDEKVMEIKVIDFSLARHISYNMKLTKGIGTSYYMSPQVKCENEKQYPREVDLYSLGVSLFQTAFNKDPYEKSQQGTQKFIDDGGTYHFPKDSNCSILLAHLINKMIQSNRDNKNLIKFRDYFYHPWFTADLGNIKKISEIKDESVVSCNFDSINESLQKYFAEYLDSMEPEEESLKPHAKEETKESQYPEATFENEKSLNNQTTQEKGSFQLARSYRQNSNVKQTGGINAQSGLDSTKDESSKFPKAKKEEKAEIKNPMQPIKEEQARFESDKTPNSRNISNLRELTAEDISRQQEISSKRLVQRQLGNH